MRMGIKYDDSYYPRGGKHPQEVIFAFLHIAKIAEFCASHRHIITLDWRLLLNAPLPSVFPNSLHNSWRNDAAVFI